MKRIPIKYIISILVILLSGIHINAQTPAVPTIPTAMPNCGEIILTRGTPPAGVTWYWQQYDFYKNTSNSAETFVPPSYTSTYYLKAKNNSSGQWSDAVMVDYSMYSSYSTYVSTPSSSDLDKDTNSDGSVTLSRDDPPSGETWFWQQTSDGTSLANSQQSFTVTSGSIYYLRARDNASGCWSGARSISFTTSFVSSPPVPSVSYNCNATYANPILTRGTPPAGQTWYWQSSPTGTTTYESGVTYQPNSGSAYYLRARNESSYPYTWSEAVSVNYHRNVRTPDDLSSIFLSNNTNNDGSVTLFYSYNAGSNEAHYWQETINGTEIDKPGNQSITLYEGNTYYLRTVNELTNCWSDPLTINYTINIVDPPSMFTSAYDCNSGDVTFTRGTPPAGVTWYWQSSNTGTSRTYSNLTRTLTYGSGTYYLRARDNSTGVWSSSVGLNYSANESTPNRPYSSDVSKTTNSDGSVTLSRANHPNGETYYWQTTASGVSMSNSQSSFIVTSGNIYYLRARNNTTGCWGDARSISYSAINIPIPDIPIVTYNCNVASYQNVQPILTRGNPPSGVIWYWQSSPTGTSTYNNSGVTFTPTSGSIYYLRARSNSGYPYYWSDAVSVNYVSNENPPSAPSSYSLSKTTNSDGSVTLSRPNPPSGETYYWQAASDGEDITNSQASFTLTSGNKYYLRARNNGTGCWSGAVSISYTAYDIEIPVIPTVTQNCGSVILTREAPPSGFTWYWQGSATGTSKYYASETYTRNSGTIYYLRANANGTNYWGDAVAIPFTLSSDTPERPNWVTKTNNYQNTVLTRTSPPDGITWYWQNSLGGKSTENSDESITLTDGDTFYLRAFNPASGCWSYPRVIEYTINNTPPPIQPTITYNCSSSGSNSVTLTREDPPQGITWYWQSSADGDSTYNNSSKTFTRTEGSTYYLRARDNASGIWSADAVEVNYIIKPIPQVPAMPTVVNNGIIITLTRGEPNVNETLYWQSSSDGESIDYPGMEMILNDGATYYLRSKDNDTGCWGLARAIHYALQPELPIITNNCGNTVLTKTANKPDGVTWYWQNNTEGVVTTSEALEPSITLNSGTVYYLRARHNTSGVWSVAQTINYTIDEIPNKPSSPSVVYNGDQVTLTATGMPADETWYWQTADGEITDNPNPSITLTEGSFIYLKARNNGTSCWGEARKIHYVLMPKPVTITNNCDGTTVLTRENDLPENISYHWQTSANGFSGVLFSGAMILQSPLEVTQTGGTRHYLRAYNSILKQWSESRVIDYEVYQKPSIPTQPSITMQDGRTILTKGTSNETNVNWYWQSSPDEFNTDAISLEPSVTLEGGTTYYLKAYNTVTECWGDARTINYKVRPYPPSQPNNIVTDCGKTTLYRANSPQGITWFWQDRIDGVTKTNSEPFIELTGGSTYYLRANNDATNEWSTITTIPYNVRNVPNIPNTPNINYNDGNTTLNFNGTPEPNVVWYWQNSIDGFDTTNSANSITLYDSNNDSNQYFLRAYNTNSQCWSDSRVINYTIETNPLVPPTPLIDTQCGVTVLTRNEPTNPNERWYWGSSVDGYYYDSKKTLEKSNGNVCYLKAYNTKLNVWSDPLEISYTITQKPAIPTIQSVTFSNGNAIVTRNNPPENVTYYWQTYGFQENTTSSGLTKTVEEGKIVYLKAYNSAIDCWSNPISVNTHQNETPDAPTINDVTVTPDCGSVILEKFNQPTGILWYWQTEPNGKVQYTIVDGEFISNYSTTKILQTGNKYYLRAINAATSNWSETSLEINYTIDPLPEMPPLPEISYAVGETTLTKNGNPPSGIEWYWQSEAIGEDDTAIASANNPKVLTSGNKYYVRAKNTATGCWSEARLIDYVISNTAIDIPIAPLITESCGSTTLKKKTISIPFGLSWYWQTDANGTTTDASALETEVSFTTSGTHYLRARQKEAPYLWSNALPITYSVYHQPDAPVLLDDISIVNNSGNTKISIVGTIPENVKWYWQTTANGVDVTNESLTRNFEEVTPLFLRAKNTKVADCWSDVAIAIPFTIDANLVPTPNAVITTDENCGDTDLSYQTNQVPDEINWFWQSQATGENSTFSANSISLSTLNTNGFYYLRAQDGSGNWSEALKIPYTIKIEPAIPSIEPLENECGKTTISFLSQNVPANTTWYWQTSPENEEVTDIVESKTMVTVQPLYLKARNDNGCWSEALEVIYTVDETPNAPTQYDFEITKIPGETEIKINTTIPTGVSWYWQTQPENEEITDTAILKTITLYQNLYIKAKNDNGCWSEALTIDYVVDPSVLTPVEAAIGFDSRANETDIFYDVNLVPIGDTWYWQTSASGVATTNSNPFITLSEGNEIFLRAYKNNEWSYALKIDFIINTAVIWYADTDNDGFGDPNSSISSATKPVGYVANNYDGCPTIYSEAGGCPETTINWTQSTAFDITGKIVSISKSYFDDLGKDIQSQSVAIKTGRTWASQTLYDTQGRPALNSLSAPVYENGGFTFNNNFIQNSSNIAYTNTDLNGDPNNPKEIGNATGTLGWYYSNLNTDSYFEGNNYQDITEYPFSRTIYSDLNPGSVLRVVGGNKMDNEWKNGYTFSMPASEELSQLVAFGEAKYNNIKTIKTISRDVGGVENVVFSDTDGKVLAAARSGFKEGNDNSRTSTIGIGEQGYVDIHIPKGRTGITISNSTAVEVFNLITELKFEDSASSLPNGFYRIAVIDMGNYTTNSISVTYPENYYDYSLNEYNKVGQLIASYQPVGETKAQKPVSTFEYDALGQLITTTSPDEGTAEFKYRRDGQIRFSQNSKQSLAGEFSYTTYDDLGRPTVSGVHPYNTTITSFESLDAELSVLQFQTSEQNITVYDSFENVFYKYPLSKTIEEALTDLGLSTIEKKKYKPTFLAGNVAITYTRNPETTTTWYSYDIYGRVKWIVQNINGLGTKTIDYQYDPVTSAVTKVDFQRYTTEERFIHQYTYNNVNELIKVETSTDDTTFTTQADYKYYETGALRRVELAEGLQGIDYVYNLNGQLKSINHPSLDSIKDPGGDANDLFGLAIDYHKNDYNRTQRANINSTTIGTDQFNGNIKATRWNNDYNKLENAQNAYSYQYNTNNWLTGANYGTYSNSSLTQSANNSYQVSGIEYDANGNISKLKRRAEGVEMDDFTYNYKTGKPNQLDHVVDSVITETGADDLKTQASGNYTYNTIGQLIENVEEGVKYTYNASGLVTEVLKNNVPLVKFFYNDKGMRVRKEAFDLSGNPIKTEYYVRDAAGSVLAIYNGNQQKELPIYGASRLGIYNKASDNSVYQLTDHLGNVRATVMRDINSNAEIASATDYYPFGMPMPGKQMIGGELYRYAFQGQEKDPETGKEAFQLRLWDGRIGRWLTTDPYGQYNSPYVGMGNDPINGIDPDGGYKTWFGAALGWIGNGFSGSIFRSDVATGNHKYGIGLTGDGGSGAGELAGTFMAYSQGDLNSYNFNTANSSWRFDSNGNGHEIDIMKPYESNLAGKVENWTNHYNKETSIEMIGLKRLGAVLYDAVDGLNIFTTSMIYGGSSGGRHLNGSVASQDDKLFSFISLAASQGGKIVLNAGRSGLNYMSKDAFRAYLNKNSTFFIQKTQRKVMFNAHNSNITKEIILLKDYNHLIYVNNLFDKANTIIQE